MRRDRRRRPARRAAGHQLGVGALTSPRIDHRTEIARLVGRPHGELVIVELAEHHRALRPQIGGDRRLIGRRELAENVRAGRGANVFRAEQILDAERDAFERTALAFAEPRIAGLRHLERPLGRRQHIGVERRGSLDGVKMRLRQLLRGKGLGAQAVAGFGNGEVCQFGGAHELCPLLNNLRHDEIMIVDLGRVLDDIVGAETVGHLVLTQAH